MRSNIGRLSWWPLYINWSACRWHCCLVRWLWLNCRIVKLRVCGCRISRSRTFGRNGQSSSHAGLFFAAEATFSIFWIGVCNWIPSAAEPGLTSGTPESLTVTPLFSSIFLFPAQKIDKPDVKNKNSSQFCKGSLETGTGKLEGIPENILDK